jgi:hypothetical protein
VAGRGIYDENISRHKRAEKPRDIYSTNLRIRPEEKKGIFLPRKTEAAPWAFEPRPGAAIRRK